MGWGGIKSVGILKFVDWRVFVFCYGVLIMLVVFGKFGCLFFDGILGGNKFIFLEERNCFMFLFEIIDLGMCLSIFNVWLDYLDEFNNKFICYFIICYFEVIVNIDLYILDGKGFGIFKNFKLR